MASGGAAPRPTVVSPTPKTEDKAVQEAAAEAARRHQKSRGFRSTILSKSMPESAPALRDTLGS